MKRKLKMIELKSSLEKNGSKNELDLKSKNVDLRSQLSQVTSELDFIKIKHAKLEKNNLVVKGELTQTKQQLEKLYSSSDKIGEQMSIQRPTYDKTSVGYLLGQSAKKLVSKEMNLVINLLKLRKI